MKITLSSNNILLQVYARAALDATVRDSYQTMLSPDRRAALQTLMAGVAAQLSVELLCVLVDTNVDKLQFDAEADTLIEFELRDGSVASSAALRLLLEQAMVARLLDEVYSFGGDAAKSAAFADSYRMLLRRIASALSRPVADLRIARFP